MVEMHSLGEVLSSLPKSSDTNGTTKPWDKWQPGPSGWDHRHFMPGDNRLVVWQHLPTSESLRKNIEYLTEQVGQLGEGDWRHRSHLEAGIAHAERRLALAIQRDAVQSTRPEDCWCLGTGGRGAVTVGDGDLQVYTETCCCPDGLEEQERRDTLLPEIRREAQRMAAERMWARSGIPYRLSWCRLETWPSAQEGADILHRLAPERRSLFLWGPVGRGKTGLAIGYAWECLRALDIHSLRFVDVPEMLATFRATYNHPSSGDDTPTEQELIARYVDVDLLVLDDLGAEQVKNTGWVEDRLYQVIGGRHAAERPTVFTSNLSLQELEGRIGERVSWRIMEMVGGAERSIDLHGLPNLREW